MSEPAAVTGVLKDAAIEGGRVYLEARDGIRYEVLWPAGWRVDRDPLALIGPDGETAASGGEMITVRGELAEGVVSLGQLGPIFRAADVVSIR